MATIYRLTPKEIEAQKTRARLRSSTRGIPCDRGKNGEIRAIWASESKIISVMAAPPWCCK